MPFQWPDQSEELFNSPTPDIIVSDLYLPPKAGDTTPLEEQRKDAAEAANKVAGLFSAIFADQQSDHKRRLRKTIDAIQEAYRLLRLQWEALGQSPDHGIALMHELKVHYPKAPFVFYSRKITPEDVIRVLQAGADDAIRKGALNSEQVLARLASAQTIGRHE